ncbi:MAG: hypothetical protein LBI03_09195 [Clostridiales bacterium]|jgi:hypothetical protein|nr:hypothetical protein [Clostridiales bacterium]
MKGFLIEYSGILEISMLRLLTNIIRLIDQIGVVKGTNQSDNKTDKRKSLNDKDKVFISPIYAIIFSIGIIFTSVLEYFFLVHVLGLFVSV